jgi:hypothetical protein
MTFTPVVVPVDPNSQILLGSLLSNEVQGPSDPVAVADVQNRAGWYYESTTLASSFTWTIFNGTDQNFTFGDVQNLTFIATHDNVPTNKCYIAIYSLVSNIVYSNDNVQLIPGEKCLFYANAIPANPEKLRTIKLNLVTQTGPCLPTEKLLSITLEGTNSVITPDLLRVCVENVGYQFQVDNVPVVVNLSTGNPDIAIINNTLTDTNIKLDTLNGTLGTTNGDLTALNGTLGTTNGDLTTLNGTLGTTNGDLTALNGTLGTTNGDLTALNGTLGTTNGDLTALNGTLGTNNTNLTNLNTTLQSGVITTSLPALNYDSFGRFRVSNPYTLFDSSNRYADNGLWATSTVSGGNAVFDANQGLMNLTVTATLNSEVIRETYKVFPYQPGKSLLVLNTFVGITTDGVRQRIGYFGTENGIYFQINETETIALTKCSIVKRSKIGGSVANTEVQQSAWNGDKLDGSGPSGITLNLDNAQILWMDFEWLGVGSVRVGFVINGQFILCHTFQHANIIQSTYITTASLPLRYEIKNTGVVGGTLKQICSTVISEGGYGLNGTQLSIATLLTAAANMDGTIRPVISIRLQSTRLDAIVILTAMNLIPSSASNDTFFWEIIRGGVTGPIPPSLPAWVPYTNSSVETRVYGATGGTITGGIVMASGFFSSTNQSRGSILLLKDSLFTFQLQRDSFTNTAYEITLCCKSVSSGNVFGSIDWEEISR